MSRLLLVSNRLPITLRPADGDYCIERSAGGLATGLRGLHAGLAGYWVGWPGIVAPPLSDRRRLEDALGAQRLDPIWLTDEDVASFYNGVSNGMLWPLFHSRLDIFPLDATGWARYQAVNERFAQAVLARYQPGDLIWIHDYHLALVPAYIRRAKPEAKIGFFLHIPFPPPEIFRALPWGHELLDGLAAADLVGFHTERYRENFLASLRSLRSSSLAPGLEAHALRTGVFPMGIDAGAWQSMGEDAAVVAESQRIRDEARGKTIFLGVDRLDYTKGIPRRLLALERLLERNPGLAGNLRLLQVTVPSRDAVAPYAHTRQVVDELVGRINGRFGTSCSVPVHSLSHTFSEQQLAAFYRAAEVMLVTPLQDGMNLVAKEFVAARVDGDGVLLLSEFAGAAERMPEALLVNPYDIDETAKAMERAIALPENERRYRMARLRERVKRADVTQWADAFLAELRAPRFGSLGARPPSPPPLHVHG